MNAAPDLSLANMGLTSTRLLNLHGRNRRSVQLQPVLHGLKVGRNRVLEYRDLCIAVAMVLGDPCFSHHTALKLLEVDLPRNLDNDRQIHVLVSQRGQRRRRKEVTSHLSGRPFSTQRVRGLKVVAPARAWLDSIPRLSLVESVVLADGLLRRQGAVSSIDLLQAEVASASGARDVRKARRALELVRANTDSPMETRMRLLIVADGLPCPEVNPKVFSPDGEFLGYADLAYVKYSISIEFDGEHHRTDSATWQKDIQRTRRFEAHGWRRIQVTKDDVFRDPRPFLARVRQELVQRAGSF